MAGRPYWTGQIRVSLVTMPVRLYSAVNRAAQLQFHMIHEPTGKRVHHENIVKGIGPVPREEIIKGYEYEKGHYILLKPEEINQLKLESKKTVDIVQFVENSAIPVLYYERPFFVEPEDKLAEDAYITIREALQKSGMIGIGQLTIQGRENLVALRPCGGGLILEILRYEDEVKKAHSFFKDVEGKKADKEKVELAQELIKKKVAKFEPGKFSDHYETALKELIEAKAKHRKVKTIEEPKHEAKVVSLMDALKKSLGEKASTAGSKKKKPVARGRKKAA